ncbi:MAG: putative polymerase delta subunit, partial [Pseudomonadota bacterium]
VSLQIDSVERQALPPWIAQRLSQQQQRVLPGEEGQRTLQFFADRVEGNLLAAHQEIQKLGLLYPAGELSFEQVESAVLNVARYDVFKLSEAVLAGNAPRVQRMLDGLQAEGESEVLVHYTLAEDIRALKRVKDAVSLGQPLPMAMREQRVWGLKERLFERVLPRLTPMALDNLLHAAHTVDGLVKGLKAPDWPVDNWQALHRLAMMLCRACAQSAKITP